jgi:Co/Zn/Cd efflux system component
VLAIVALFGGRNYGANWLDPVMGLVGTVLVGRWALGMLKGTGRALLDAEMDAPVVTEVRSAVADLPGAPAIHDLHVWRVGSGRYACVLCLESTSGLTADAVRAALAQHDELVHVTVVNPPVLNRVVEQRPLMTSFRDDVEKVPESLGSAADVALCVGAHPS